MSFGSFQKRVLIPVRQRPSSEDLNALQWERAASELISAGTAYGQNFFSAPGAASPAGALGAKGFSGGGFFVAADASSPPFGVTVQAGVGYNYVGPASATDIDSNQGADWVLNNSWAVPLVLSSDQDFTVPAPPAVGSSRIDAIEVRADYLAADPQTVGIFDPGSSVFNPTVSNKALTWDLLSRTGTVNAPSASTAPISYVVGQTVVGAITAATAPTVTSGYIQIAKINLDASAGAIAAVTQSMIADMRPMLFPQSMLQVGGRFSTAGAAPGLASINFDSAEIPPGVHVAAVVSSTHVFVAGEALPVTFYVFAGDCRPRSPGTYPLNPQFKGTASVTGSNKCVGYVSSPQTGTLNVLQTQQLSGTAVGYSVYGSSTGFGYAYGQPYFLFTAYLYLPSGSALNNIEPIYFHAMLNLG